MTITRTTNTTSAISFHPAAYHCFDLLLRELILCVSVNDVLAGMINHLALDLFRGLRLLEVRDDFGPSTGRPCTVRQFRALLLCGLFLVQGGDLGLQVLKLLTRALPLLG